MRTHRARLLLPIALIILSLVPGAPLLLAQPATGRKPTPPTTRKPRTGSAKVTPRRQVQTSASTNGRMAIVLNRTGNEGILSGIITWTGEVRQPLLIDTSADQACTQNNPNLSTEDLIVYNGRAANVLVFLEAGTTFDGKQLSDLRFDIPTNEVVLEQRGCRFVPHVLGIQINQTLKITNNDPTVHNVHFVPRSNPDWNQSQPPGAAPLKHRFSYAETRPFSVKDNQHPWKRAYIGVFNHPYFAVTGMDGSFEIRGVPPGTYKLSAWHERAPGWMTELGTVSIQVTVSKATSTETSPSKASPNPTRVDEDPVLTPPDTRNLQPGDTKSQTVADPATEKVFRAGEVDQRAQVLEKPPPVYTEAARKNSVTGFVVLRAVLSSTGQVTNITVVRGLPDGLTERAIAAAKQLKFNPAMKDGKPVSQYVQLEYILNLY